MHSEERAIEITTFDPLVLTPKADDVLEVFAALGFERVHAPVTATETNGDVLDVRMKHPEGFHVDVAGIPALPRDMVMIRMNVRDFDEAYKILIDKGFTNARGDKILVTESAKTATMESPSGFRITIVEHFRK